MKIEQPLQFYVDKIKNGEKFSMARYGDGELYCMWGKQGQNSNGCKYYPELRADLLKGLTTLQMKPNFIYGLQRVLPRDEERVMREYGGIDWYDTEIFSEAVAKGELYPLVEQLRKMKVVVIGNNSITDFCRGELGVTGFIYVEPSNAYDQKEHVLDHVKKLAKLSGADVFLFSCGMAANVFIHELHGKVDGWLLDMGHIWDPFTGNMSRCDLEGKTLEDINKNLYDRNDLLRQ
jgi:hypothetical protein